MSNVRVNAEIQNTREVSATRIKDELYIFNGTYPLYYKGDGNLYLLPEHDTTYTEIVVAGHNTMMANFEENYYPNINDLSMNAVSVFNNSTANDSLFRVTDFKFSPKLPFERRSDFTRIENEQISFKAVFSIPEIYFGAAPEKKLFVEIFQRPALPGNVEGSYQEVGVARQRFKNVLTTPPTTIGAENTPLILTTAVKNNIAAIEYRVDIGNIDVGIRDILLLFTIRETVNDETVVLAQDRVEIRDLTISAIKIENYPINQTGLQTRGGFRLKAPWTANKVIEHYGQLIAWGSTSMPSTVFISNNFNLSYFPFLYTFTFETDENERINSITPYMNILVVQSDSKTWGIKGTNPVRFLDAFGEVPNPNAYTPFSINLSIGNIAPKSVRPVRNRLYFLSQEGLMELTSLFATDDRYNVRPLDRNIENIIPRDRKAVAIQFDNQYWINFPSTGETFRYYIDKEAWVKDTYNFKEFNGIYQFYNRNGKLHMVTQPMLIEEGNGNFTLYEAVVDESLATDLGVPISSKFLTSKLSQDYPFHWKRYQEMKLDFSIQNQYMPNRSPITLADSKISGFVGQNVETIFTGTFEPFHYYTVAYNTILDEDLEPINVNNNTLTAEVKNGMIRFQVLKNVPDEIVIRFPKGNLTIDEIEEFTVVDDTYDKGLLYDLRIMADNNTLIRDDFDSYAPVTKAIEIDAGSQFENLNFGFTKFGDVTTFVQTTKLYGNGYNINMYYRDESNIKWTLETIGITYKMRRTRSDKRG